MPFIDRDFINDLSQRVDIVDLINRRVPLKKVGKDYKACCPFHNEKTPSFTVAPDKQIYHCFGCGESGNAIDFVMNFDHLDFKEAVETVASESGVSVVYDQAAKPVDPRLARYRELMQKVCEFYKHQLKTSVAKGKVVNYANKKRGLTGEIAKRFELGFAPPGWNNLYNYFKDNVDAIKDLETMGLLVAKKDKKDEYYDRFRDRLMFPIHNSKGNVIAFGGRVLSNDDQPKYLNSPETPIFSKSHELYGLHHARKHSRSIDYILVVEGYMDVVALHQAGITKTVATLGTATTKEHLQILSRTTNNIIFCFDGDRAGRDAAWKALNIALPVIKSGLTVKFLFLPDGEDPDSLVKKESVKSFESRIEKSSPLSKFLFDHIKNEVEFDTIEGKTLFIDKVIEFINKVNYDIYKQQLIEGLAQLVGQSVDHIRSMLSGTTADYTPDFATDMPIDIEQIPDVDIEYYQQEYTDPDNNKHSQVLKNLMSRMMSIILNYPSLADDTIELRVRRVDNSDVLLDIIQSAQIDENISQEDLIQPFAAKTKVFNRLKELCTLTPHLSEKQAKDELLSAINSIEKYQTSSQTKDSITSASTIEEQRKIMENIQKSKK